MTPVQFNPQAGTKLLLVCQWLNKVYLISSARPYLPLCLIRPLSLLSNVVSWCLHGQPPEDRLVIWGDTASVQQLSPAMKEPLTAADEAQSLLAPSPGGIKKPKLKYEPGKPAAGEHEAHEQNHNNNTRVT